MNNKTQVKVLLGLMDFLERQPTLVDAFLRPVSRVPFISRRLMVLPKAFMGQTAF